ncbi:MAG TPA: penicillin-insensitive murein endopeptidase [Minicystis sp.]|nr:penicillin-insensitive murein endopeptidase [Minicystis sp.]
MHLRRAALVFAAAFSFALSGAALAAPKKEHKKPRSIGAPNHGKLEGASHLHRSKHLLVRKGAEAYGLPQLTRALRHAADRVGSKYRGSVLLVGDLSAKDGGPLTHHNSHQTGRDADVGFYVMNEKGKPVGVKHFVAFDGKGVGKELTWARFDDARNWFFVESLLKDQKAAVHYIFITNALKARLLAYAQKHHASKELVARAAAAMMSPQEADPHDDHFHVRVSCPEDMKECVEEATLRAPAAAAAAAREASPPAAQGG